MSSLPDSSLSPTVITLLRCLQENSAHQSSQIYNDCVDEFGLLNWSVLETALPTDDCDQSYECYLNAVCNLSPAFNRVSIETQKICLDEYFTAKFAWTQNVTVFKKCIELLKSKDSILSLQLMTSTLERILGNIYLLREKKTPSLLKDLLSSTYLKEIFGACPMRIIQILMGAPTSLNLRNLAWHGFLAPNELPEDCCWFLLAVIAALGKILKHKNIGEDDIPRRFFFTVLEMTDVIDTFPLLDTRLVVTKIGSFNVIQESMMPCWKLSLNAFKEGRYADCVIGILPLFENVLRRIFACVNHCPERILTAESSVLFTTIDEILARDVHDVENKFRSFVGDNFMLMLLDLFLLPDGPRLRDHLSHGEIDFNSINCQLANHVVSISVTACILASKLFDTSENEDDFSNEMLGYIKNYKSEFAPHVQCSRQICNLITSLNTWSTILEEEKNLMCVDAIFLEEIASISLQNCQQFLSIPEISRMLLVDGNLEVLQSELSNSNLQLIHRPQIEIAKIMQLTRIAATSQCASTQIQNNVKTQLQKKQQFQLRSRNRETFLRMLKVISNLAAGLRIVTVFLVVEFLKCQRNDSDDKTRLFRCLLRYVDKLKALTNCQKNRWEESETVTKTFLTQLANFQ